MKRLVMTAQRTPGVGLSLTLSDVSGTVVTSFSTSEPIGVEAALAQLDVRLTSPLPADAYRSPYVTAHVVELATPWTHHPKKVAA